MEEFKSFEDTFYLNIIKKELERYLRISDIKRAHFQKEFQKV